MIPVVMPTYRGEKRLPKVLECLNSQDVEIDIFIRDNNVKGVYYTKAINEGLRKFAFNPGIEFCLVTCDDVYLKPNCIKELLKCAKDHPRAGIISPVQYSPNGTIEWAGSAQSWPLGAHVSQVLKDEPYVSYWASGACFLVRTEMIKEIGLMDENMLFICSDSDYSLTARSRGWFTMVAPDAHVQHTFHQSRKSVDPEIDIIKTKDLVHFSRKWVTGNLFRSLEYQGAKRVNPDAAIAQESNWVEYVIRSQMVESHAVAP